MSWVLERAVLRLVVGDLVVDIGLVEGGAVELGELRALGGRLLGQRLAGGVVLPGVTFSFLTSASACSFTRGMVALACLRRKRAHPCSWIFASACWRRRYRAGRRCKRYGRFAGRSALPARRRRRTSGTAPRSAKISLETCETSVVRGCCRLSRRVGCRRRAEVPAYLRRRLTTCSVCVRSGAIERDVMGERGTELLVQSVAQQVAGAVQPGFDRFGLQPEQIRRFL